MWNIWIASYKVAADGKYVRTAVSETLSFPTRFEAEIHMSNIVQANPDASIKMLGFLTSPWGDNYTVDPTLVFWNKYYMFTDY